MKKFIFILLVSLFSINTYSQDSLKINVNGDIVSRFVFRGIDVSNAPAIQPVVTLSKGNLTVGCWGYIFHSS